MGSPDTIDHDEVSEQLQGLNDLLQAVRDISVRESSRRTEASHDMAAHLPADVLAILVTMDEQEATQVQARDDAHQKFVTIVEKYLNKFKAEQQKHKIKMDKLADAQNPEAEAGYRNKHREAVAMLQAEMDGYLSTRVQLLDQEHCLLDYIRDKANLCCEQAKAILTGEVVEVGSHDVVSHLTTGTQAGAVPVPIATLPDNDQLMALVTQLVEKLKTEEMEPLLEESESDTDEQQLLQRSFSGRRSRLKRDSSYSLNKSQSLRSLNKVKPDGAKDTSISAQQRISVDASPGQPSSTSDLVISIVSVTETSAVDDEAAASESLTDVSSRYLLSPTTTNQKKKDVTKKMIEKHTIENVKLETSLHEQEAATIKQLLEEAELKSKDAIAEAVEKMKEELSAAHEEEKEQLMLKHAEHIEQLMMQLEAEKEAKLQDQQNELIEIRKEKQKELIEAHRQEAKLKGLDNSVLVDGALMSQEKLQKDLEELARHQQKLLNDLLAADLEEDDEESRKKKAALNQKMEARIKELNDTLKQSLQKIISESEDSSQDITLSSRQSTLKARLASRMKGRRKHQEDGTSSQSGLANVRKVEAVVVQAVVASLLEEERKQQREALATVDADDQTKAALIEQFKQDAEDVDKQFGMEKKWKKLQAVAMMTAQNVVQEEMNKEMAVNEQLKVSSATQAQLSDPAGQLPQVDAQSEGAQQARESLVQQQVEQQAQLEVEIEQERLKVEEEMDSEKSSHRKLLEKQAEQQKRKMLQKKELAFQRELAEKQRNLTTEQSEKMMQQHREEMQLLESSLTQEKEQQKETLAKKIAEKKQQAAEKLAQKKRLERERLLAEQKKERDHLESKLLKDAEMAALTSALAEKRDGEEEKLIYRVLQQRHLREGVQLAEEHERQKNLAIEERKAALRDTRAKERDELIAKKNEAMVDLISNSASLSVTELEQKKQKLNEDLEQKLAEFDQRTEEKLNNVPKEVIPEQEVAYNHKVLELRERQIRDLVNVMEELTPEKALVQSYKEEAEKAAAKAERFRIEVIEARKNKLEELKEARRRKEEERKQGREQQIKELEAEIQREQEKDLQRQKELKERYDKIQQNQLAAREQEHVQRLAKMGDLTEQERQRLIDSHKKEMEQLEVKLGEEKDNQLNKLKDEIFRRRKKKQEKKRKELEASAAKEESEWQQAEEQEKEELLKINEQQANELRQHVEDIPRPSTPSVPQFRQEQLPESEIPSDKQLSPPPPDIITTEDAPDTMPHKMIKPHPKSASAINMEMSDQDLSNLLMSTPLFSQLSEIEAIVKLQSTVGGAAAQTTSPYIDLRDAQWVCSGDLVAMDIEKLRPANFVVYRFGVFVSNLLQARNNMPEVTILVASNLPPNNYTRNCFRNSFHYEHTTKILFVREERMETVGEFVLVVIHCLSHIKVDELTDDYNPDFLREFYKAIKTCCQDLFFARSHLNLSQLSGGSQAMEAAIQASSTLSSKINVVNDLINVKVNAPSNLDFSPEHLEERLAAYHSYLDEGRLHQLVHADQQSSEASHDHHHDDGDVTSKRLQQLGMELPPRAPEVTQSKPRTRRISHTAFKSPRELVDRQILELQEQLDQLHHRLKDTVKEGLQHQQGDGLSTKPQEQTATVELKRKNLLRDIETLTKELEKKRQSSYT